jgi:hypothetical protein
MEGMANGCASPEREDTQEVRHECQRIESPGISGVEPLDRTAGLLPHLQLLLVGKVCACLPASIADRVGWAVATLSETDALLRCMEDHAQPGGIMEYGCRRVPPRKSNLWGLTYAITLTCQPYQSPISIMQEQ